MNRREGLCYMDVSMYGVGSRCVDREVGRQVGR